MTPRQFLRNLCYTAADLVPWQLVAVARGRDWNQVNAAADALADEEAEYEVLEPPAGVEPAPRVPPAGPDLQFAAGVVRAYAALAPELYDRERTDLRALADRLIEKGN